MACAGLIWMQIALKEDLDSLKEKLHSSKTPKQTLLSFCYHWKEKKKKVLYFVHKHFIC